MKSTNDRFTRTLRLPALILAALLLFSAVSCAETGETKATESATPGVIDETGTENTDYLCELPDDLHFGTEVNYLYTDVPTRGDELVSENYGAGVISDSVYERNATVSDRLGVTLYFIGRNADGETIMSLAALTKAGDTSVDVVVLGTYMCMTPVLAGDYLNLNGVPNLDLSKRYWNQDYNEMMTFTSDNLQFVATSPTAISIFRNGYLTIFNRDKMEEYRMPDLYEVVNNGKWTLDYQYNLIKEVYTDANGDGKCDDKDFFGFAVGNVTDMDVYGVASAVHPIIRDENGDLCYNADGFDRMVEMGDKVSTLCNSAGTYLAVSFNEGFDKPIQMFTESRALMATAMFGLIETNIEYLADISYGIAPIPKLTEDQARYGTYIQDQVSSFGISAAIVDAERQAVIGAVMEAMSYYSYLIVRPAYYDVSLSLRFMQDAQSKAILDTMFESISFDYTYSTSTGGIRDGLRTAISAPKPTIASQAKKWEKSAANALKQQQKSLDRIKNAG